MAKPLIITKLEELESIKLNRSEFTWNGLPGKPSTFPPDSHSHGYVPVDASCNRNWNWSWGTATPTHLWGSQGSSNDFYVYRPDQVNAGHAKKAGAQGSSTFAGNSVARTIAHGLGRTPVYASACPKANPGGNLGEVWVTYDATNINVYNSGSATTAFNWIAM